MAINRMQTCPRFLVSRQTGSYPETGFNEASRISNEKYASVYECFSSGRITAYTPILIQRGQMPETLSACQST